MWRQWHKYWPKIAIQSLLRTSKSSITRSKGYIQDSRRPIGIISTWKLSKSQWKQSNKAKKWTKYQCKSGCFWDHWKTSLIRASFIKRRGWCHFSIGWWSASLRKLASRQVWVWRYTWAEVAQRVESNLEKRLCMNLPRLSWSLMRISSWRSRWISRVLRRKLRTLRRVRWIKVSTESKAWISFRSRDRAQLTALQHLRTQRWAQRPKAASSMLRQRRWSLSKWWNQGRPSLSSHNFGSLVPKRFWNKSTTWWTC